MLALAKFGNIPDGGGHRFVGRQHGAQNKRTTQGLPRGKDYKPRTGTAYLHTVIDDHSRGAYVEIHGDEKSQTAIAVLQRAVACFAERGVTIERVLSDNGSCYRSFPARHRRRPRHHPETDPALPPADQRQERFHRTVADGWTLARVAEVIERVTGIRHGTTQTWTILRERLRWSVQRPARRALERNDEAIATWVKQDWPRIKKARGAAAPGSASKTRAGSASSPR